MPTSSDYLKLSQAIYTPGTLPNAPDGWTVLHFESDDDHGMQAAAFQNNTTHEIVIAYEGTNNSSAAINSTPEMFSAQVGADAAIAGGFTPAANAAALNFAKSIHDQYGDVPIYLTGHSLGAEEAQYVDARAAYIAGGEVYGGPGVPDQQASAGNGTFTNILDYGDGVGDFIPPNGGRVGNVQFVGNPQDGVLEDLLVGTVESPVSQLAKVVIGLADHDLYNYAKDLGVTLTPPVGDVNLVSPAYIQMLSGGFNAPLFGGASGQITVDGNVITERDSNGNPLDSLTLNSDGTSEISLFDTANGGIEYGKVFLDSSGNVSGTRQLFSDGSREDVTVRASSTVTDEYNPQGNPTTSFTNYGSDTNVSTVYSQDPNSTWFSKADIVVNGELTGTTTVNRDGTSELVQIDRTTGNKVVTDLDADNEITSQKTVAGENTTQPIDYNNFVRAIADALATQLISKFLTQNNLPATVAVQAFADAVIASATAPAGQPVNFSTELATSAFDIAGGLAGSAVGAELAELLGLPPEAGQIVGGTTGNLLAQSVLKIALNDFNIPPSGFLNPDALASGIAGAGGAVLGSMLADSLLPTNEAGQIIGSLATAAAVYAAGDGIALAGFLALQPELAPLAIFAVAFGSDFIGTIIGDIFGGLFGNDHPSIGPVASSINQWDGGAGKFYLGSFATDNGGTTAGVAAMGNAMNTIMNNTIAAIGGNVIGQPQQMSLMWVQNKYYYAFGNHYPDTGYPTQFADPNSAVEAAAIRWMSTLTIANGNAYMEYVAKHSTATKLADFYADLNVAHAYSVYIADPAAFDAALALANDPAQFAIWQQELARAEALGLDKLTAAEIAGLHQYGYITRDNLPQFGTILGSGANFLADNTKEYFVDSGAGLVAYQFGDKGILINKVALHNANGSAFVLPSTTVIGTDKNFAGLGEYDLITWDAGGHLAVTEFNAQGQVIGSMALTNSDGSSFGYGNLVSSQFVGTARNLLGHGGHDIFSQNANGQISVNEFNASGQLVGSTALSYPSGTVSPFAFTQEAIPTFGSDAYGVFLRGLFRAIGYTGTFADGGKAEEEWYEDNFGVPFANDNIAGAHQLLDKLAELNPTIAAASRTQDGGYELFLTGHNHQLSFQQFNASGIFTHQQVLSNADGSVFTLPPGATPSLIGDDFFGQNGRDVMLVDSAGHVSVTEFDLSGKAFPGTNVSVYAKDGSLFTLPSGAAFLETAYNFYGQADHDLIFKQADGSLHIVGFDAVNRVHAIADQEVTNADGSTFILPAGSSLVSVGQNFLGAHGFDLLTIDTAGQVGIMELDASGKAVSYNGASDTPLYMPDGGHLILPQGSELLFNASDYFGNGERDLVFKKPDGTVQIFGFGTLNPVQAVASQTLKNADGSIFVLPANATLQLAAEDFYAHSGTNFLLLDEVTGQASMIEVDATGKIFSGANQPLYVQDGGHLTLPADTTIIGGNYNFYNQADHDLYFRYADGSVHVLGFSSTDRVRAIGSTDLTIADATPFLVQDGTRILGNLENAMGVSAHDLVLQQPDGRITINVFDAQGKFVSGSSPALIASNFLGHGGQDVVLMDGSGNLSASEVDATGMVLGKINLLNADGSAFVLSGVTALPAGTNFFGQNGLDLMVINGAGQVSMTEFDATGKAYLGTNVPLYVQDGGHFYLPAGATLLGAGYNFYGQADHDLLFTNASGGLQIMGFDAVNRVHAIANESLKNADGTAFQLAAGAAVIGAAQNLLGGNGHDLIIQANDGTISVNEFDATGQLLPGGSQPLALGQTFTPFALAAFHGPTTNIVIESNSTLGLDAANSPASVLGNHDTINVDAHLSTSLLGSHNTITLAGDDDLTIYRGTDNAVSGSGDTVHLGSQTETTINGGGHTIDARDGAVITFASGQAGLTNSVTLSNSTINVADNNLSALDVSGGGNTLQLGDNDWASLHDGDGSTVAADDNALVGFTDTDNNTLTAGAAAGVAATHSDNNVMTLGNGATLWLTDTQGDVISASNALVYAYDNVDATIHGSGNTIGAYAGDSLTLGGNGQYGTADTVYASGVTIHVEDDASVTVIGDGNLVSGEDTDLAHIKGNNNDVSLGASGLAWIEEGNGNVVHASAATMLTGANTQNTTVIGNDNLIYAGDGSSLNLSGHGDGVIGSNMTLYLDNNAINTVIQGDNDIIHVRAGSSYQINGTNDTVIVDTVTAVHDGDTLAHFNGVSDLLDMTGLVFDESITAHATMNADNISAELVVSDHGAAVATIHLATVENLGSFHVRPDGQGGTLLVDPVEQNGASVADEHFSMFSNAGSDQFNFVRDALVQEAQHMGQPAVGVTGDSFDFGSFGKQLASAIQLHDIPSFEAPDAVRDLTQSLHDAFQAAGSEVVHPLENDTALPAVLGPSSPAAVWHAQHASDWHLA